MGGEGRCTAKCLAPTIPACRPPLKDQSLNFVKTDPKDALSPPAPLPQALGADGEIETQQGQGLAPSHKPVATLRPE